MITARALNREAVKEQSPTLPLGGYVGSRILERCHNPVGVASLSNQAGQAKVRAEPGEEVGLVTSQALTLTLSQTERELRVKFTYSGIY
jgi:hypothetical protein